MIDRGCVLATDTTIGPDVPRANKRAGRQRYWLAAVLLAYLQGYPQYARFYQVTLGADGQPNPEEVSRAAQENSMIRVQLGQQSSGM